MYPLSLQMQYATQQVDRFTLQMS
ncbi:hypothetical protein CO2235_210032 [Cupriavidus oxalaticus]|uniref:Uncharacterized protein n=1 Tax=Cupriavidus oxalaticus TaxID=96344 RepID=A0A375GAA1_9BURK|nr:hypothetical protein CO2235_210032 [Cupriavidus oxalaticus]